MTHSPPTRWFFAASGTIRGIYALRYFLFSGGLAIAGALAERAARHDAHSWVGFWVGLALGMVLFRAQLRAFGWPTLALSQDTVYLSRKKQAVIIPWPFIREVVDDGRDVTLLLATPVSAPGGEPLKQVRLIPPSLGVGRAELLVSLRDCLRGAEFRSLLPEDARVRLILGLGPL